MQLKPKQLVLVLVTVLITASLCTPVQARNPKKKITPKPIPKEYLPLPDAETVESFFKKIGFSFNKKPLYVRLSIAYKEQGTPKSMVKLLDDPVSIQALKVGVLLGYRIKPGVFKEIGRLEFGFPDKTTFTVLITENYFYIKHGQQQMPFKSAALSKSIAILTLGPEAASK